MSGRHDRQQAVWPWFLGLFIGLGLVCLLARPVLALEVTTDWQEADSPAGVEGVSFAVLKLPQGGYLAYYMAMANGMQALSSDDGILWSAVEGFVPPRVEGEQDLIVSNPWVFQTSDGRYRMIFEVQQSDGTRLLHSAISDDALVFTYEGVVMSGSEEDRCPSQDADSSGSPPFAARDQDPAGKIFLSVPTGFRQDDGSLRMYFVSRGDSIATAVSYDDGLTWERAPGYCLQDAVDPAVVILPGGGYRMYYTDWQWLYRTKRVGYADSSDGVSFTPQGWIVSLASYQGVIVDPEVPDHRPGQEERAVMFLSYGDDMESVAVHRLLAPEGWSWDLYPAVRPDSGG